MTLATKGSFKCLGGGGFQLETFECGGGCMQDMLRDLILYN